MRTSFPAQGNDVARAVFSAMGNTARITVLGSDADDLIEYAKHRLLHLEHLWSRFIPSSEISQLNLAGGSPLQVSADTVKLIRHMIGGWTLTGGLFDPSMLRELVRDGYGRSLISEALTVLPSGVEWSKDLSAVTLIEDDMVTVPVGLTLDPGGIGKGLAADILATELIERGARGVLVSLGGDIRCIGDGDVDGTWVIDIDSPFGEEPMTSIAISEGAVATSSLTAKTFPDPTADSDLGENSHIMDPHTRRPVDIGSRMIVQATVIASECVWAEVFTKAYLVLDSASRIEFAAEHGLEAMVVLADSTMSTSHGWKRYER